ncbi:hypothetical protein [Amnibacterium setariae]|uniref:hypothetical protein n=1 Tax=Amnibacterium setariae TaxID=2306585 RepID=UPI0013143A1E|nr:hypothetical protein [Amnibacterium setariae]
MGEALADGDAVTVVALAGVTDDAGGAAAGCEQAATVPATSRVSPIAAEPLNRRRVVES